MFDAGFAELILIFVIGLLILGPERLPRVAAQLGRWVARARRTANQLRYQLEREVALEEIQRTQKQVRRSVSSAAEQAKRNVAGASSTESGEHGAEASDAAAAGSEAGREPGAQPPADTEAADASGAKRPPGDPEPGTAPPAHERRDGETDHDGAGAAGEGDADDTEPAATGSTTPR